jgi:hypothetical protein
MAWSLLRKGALCGDFAGAAVSATVGGEVSERRLSGGRWRCGVSPELEHG